MNVDCKFQDLEIPNANLVSACRIGDLSGMKVALAKGASPHFWYNRADYGTDWACPVSVILNATNYEVAVKIKALDVLYENGLRECEASADKGASVMGCLKQRPTEASYSDELVQWLIDHKIGLSIPEGVGHWLEDSVLDFNNDYASAVLDHLASMGEDHVLPALFPLFSQASVVASFGRACVITSRPPNPETEFAKRRIDALLRAWPVLSLNNEVVERTGKTPQQFLMGLSLVDLMQIYPDHARLDRALNLMHGSLVKMYPDLERREWLELFDTFSKGKAMGEHDQTMRQWCCEGGRSWVASNEAQALQAHTPVIPAPSPRSRL